MKSNLPSSPTGAARRAALLRDARAFLLSALVAFLLVVGGGWYLGEQIATPPDDILSSELEQIGAASSLFAASAGLGNAAATIDDAEEWYIFIYSGPPLSPALDGDLGHARIRDTRDEG